MGMGEWSDLCVPPTLLASLSQLGFTSPTPIQRAVLPCAIRDRRDIMGAAETASFVDQFLYTRFAICLCCADVNVWACDWANTHKCYGH